MDTPFPQKKGVPQSRASEAGHEKLKNFPREGPAKFRCEISGEGKRVRERERES